MEALTWGSFIMINTNSSSISSQKTKLQRYYRWQSRFYDATRWAFLFGREELINHLPDLPPEPHILEIGCGTGKNLHLLQFVYPDAKLLGMDLSKDMLTKARENVIPNKNIKLVHQSYGADRIKDCNFDLILCSYSLTMMGSDIHALFDQIHQDLGRGGFIAVVDFHQTPYTWFRRWMNRNHVTMQGRLLPSLQKYFEPLHTESKAVYGGLWSYFMFIGR